jgi:hypothetical protein
MFMVMSTRVSVVCRVAACKVMSLHVGGGQCVQGVLGLGAFVPGPSAALVDADMALSAGRDA